MPSVNNSKNPINRLLPFTAEQLRSVTLQLSPTEKKTNKIAREQLDPLRSHLANRRVDIEGDDSEDDSEDENIDHFNWIPNPPSDPSSTSKEKTTNSTTDKPQNLGAILLNTVASKKEQAQTGKSKKKALPPGKLDQMRVENLNHLFSQTIRKAENVASPTIKPPLDIGSKIQLLRQSLKELRTKKEKSWPTLEAFFNEVQSTLEVAPLRELIKPRDNKNLRTRLIEVLESDPKNNINGKIQPLSPFQKRVLSACLPTTLDTVSWIEKNIKKQMFEIRKASTRTAGKTVDNELINQSKKKVIELITQYQDRPAFQILKEEALPVIATSDSLLKITIQDLLENNEAIKNNEYAQKALKAFLPEKAR